MAIREGSVQTAAPAQKAFDLLSDVSRHGEWAAHPLTVTRNPGPERDPGATYSCHTAMLGGIKGAVQVISEDPPGSFVFEAQDASGHFRWSFTIVPDGSGSRITYRMEPVKVPLVMAVLTDMLIWPLAGKKGFEQTLQNIKRSVEAA